MTHVKVNTFYDDCILCYHMSSAYPIFCELSMTNDVYLGSSDIAEVLSN